MCKRFESPPDFLTSTTRAFRASEINPRVNHVSNIVPVFKIFSMAMQREGFDVYSLAMMEIYCIVSGAVQNVRYRDYVQTSATQLCLTGWVRNLPDGTVAVCAQGLPDTLKELVEYLHEGSLQAKVDAVSVDWRTAKRIATDFSILFLNAYGYSF